MIRVNERTWVKESAITIAAIDEHGNFILDDTFMIDDEYLTDVCCSLNINVNEVRRVRNENDSSDES